MKKLEMKKEELRKEIEELKEQLNDRGLEFYNDYDLTTIRYWGDMFQEFADSRVSIYYSDIEEYYAKHVQESSDALKEFGYSLNDFDTLEDAMHQGSQLAEFNEIYSEVAENEDILKEIAQIMEELKELEACEE